MSAIYCGIISVFLDKLYGRLARCEELVTQVKRKKDRRMNCDVGEATEGLLENEL